MSSDSEIDVVGVEEEQNPTTTISNARCSDLIIYPINAVDQSDQYRFDYSDVGFGNTHGLGASVTVTCTTDSQPATVEGYDQQRASITSSPALIASCSQVEGSQYTWTVHTKILQFVDCRDSAQDILSEVNEIKHFFPSNSSKRTARQTYPDGNSGTVTAPNSEGGGYSNSACEACCVPGPPGVPGN
uniref:Uncharacterized protein n=1 Tax=Meloidogyne floridensis TaxID=298350 RepID=A0A915NQW8_9BILA